ncbi:uncharacterized protein LOC125768306 [Anopheles funestus]|uniref:uncharacterized protein LOC125768306 n=1 Tax=Anopheles funestus TaxID=62324 RepID=UPI0020C6255F|nr:uncharacterized protein LOC125768306 [Anopheles funestus]
MAISAHERLSATLRFLISGGTYRDVRFHTGISQPSLTNIIPETCRAIIHVLKEYMKMPRTQQEWKNIASGFSNKWQFPNCLGAADGKHVKITPPPSSGSNFFNYKKFNSVILMAIADSNYTFIMCDVGGAGSESDGGCIKKTKFYQKLVENQLNIPPDAAPPNSCVNLPYVFIGDEAFALRTNFLKPFNKRQLNYPRRVFNYCLSRARRVVENVFGILASRFRIFHSTILLKDVDNIKLLILTCCYLHNFLAQTSSSYSLGDYDAISESELIIPPASSSTNVLAEAKNVRSKYVEYFMNEGRVHWQDESIQNE